MATKLHELKKNPMVLEARGLVSGVKKETFYRSGVSKNGKAWNELNFGLIIAPRKTVYFKINGFEQNDVYYFENVKKGEKGQTVKVPWKNRKNKPGDNYRLNGIKITVDRDEETNKNVNEVMLDYDAVEYLHANMKDGESLFIRANLTRDSFTAKDGTHVCYTNFVPMQISRTDKPIDFDAEDFEEKAVLEANLLTFEGIEQEVDEDGKPTGRYLLTTYLFDYNKVETMTYIVKDAKLAKNMKKAMKPGNTIHAYGKVDIIVDTSYVEPEDDGWGDPDPKERLNSRPVTEYVITRCLKDTLDKDTYEEAKIAAAIKAIKNAKDAENKFVAESEDSGDDGWGDDSDDEDTPW